MNTKKTRWIQRQSIFGKLARIHTYFLHSYRYRSVHPVKLTLYFCLCQQQPGNPALLASQDLFSYNCGYYITRCLSVFVAPSKGCAAAAAFIDGILRVQVQPKWTGASSWEEKSQSMNGFKLFNIDSRGLDYTWSLEITYFRRLLLLSLIQFFPFWNIT